MPLLGPDLTRERYARILRCLLPVLRSWEDWSAENVPERLRFLPEPRRRSHLLLADLHALGDETAEDPAGQNVIRVPAWSSMIGKSHLGTPETLSEEPARHSAAREYEAGFLGALYVLEGSTLGGRVLARQVEMVLKLTSGQGNAYFQGHGAATGALWKEVTVEIAAVPDELSLRLIGTARRTFAAFREALEGCGPASGIAAKIAAKIAADRASAGVTVPAAAASSPMVARTPQRNQASK